MRENVAPVPHTRPDPLSGAKGAITRHATAWRRLRLVLSALGYAFLTAAMVVLIRENGGHGYDSYAYWLAGRNVLEGEALYWPHAEGVLGAYRYPPLFAQMWAPFTVLPSLAFSWAWRLVCIAALRYLAGSWINVGLWCLVPLTITEISLANVTFPVAALTLAALHGHGWAASWAGALKLGPLLLLPYLWRVDPRTRRSLAIGVLSVALACTLSVVVSPTAWSLYVESLGWLTTSDTAAPGVIALVRSGPLDLALRLGAAALLVVIATNLRSDRLAFTATIIAVPVLAIWRLAPLLALPRLRSRRPRVLGPR